MSLAVLVPAGAFSASAGEPPTAEARPFRIEVVDDETGRGVPLVELRTVDQIRYVTDSSGVVAFDEPGLIGLKVFFHVKSHGYEFPKDGFGYRGEALETRPGGSATIKVRRLNIAERLYRVTGGGIYRDTVLTGGRARSPSRVLNGQVLGQDSVVNARLSAARSTGSGATRTGRAIRWAISTCRGRPRTPRPRRARPRRRRRPDYFVGDDGFARPTCQMPGPGPTWISGLVVLHDREGRERMFANYVKIRPPLETYERGLVEFDPEARTFREGRQVRHGPGHVPRRASRRPSVPPP